MLSSVKPYSIDAFLAKVWNIPGWDELGQKINDPNSIPTFCHSKPRPNTPIVLVDISSYSYLNSQKIKYILNASLLIRMQFLCLWVNQYHNYFVPQLKEREKKFFFLQNVSLLNRIKFHCLLLNWNISYLVLPPCSHNTFLY